MFGLFAAGFMYFVFAGLIRWRGLAAVHRLLPPVVIGPVIMVIGLSVAAAASSMAMGQADGKQVIDYADSLILSGFTFAVTVVVSVFGSRSDETGADLDRCGLGLHIGFDNGLGRYCRHRQCALVCSASF